MTDNSMINYWLLKVCPLEVKRAFSDARRTANDKEQIFIYNLEEEKKYFEQDISSFKTDFDTLKKFKHFDKVTEYS